MGVEQPQAGHTYRVWDAGKEVEHFHVERVHGRRIYFNVTAHSCLLWQTTRLRWKKAVAALQQGGASITEEPTP
jgi:hypothetical protein